MKLQKAHLAILSARHFVRRKKQRSLIIASLRVVRYRFASFRFGSWMVDYGEEVYPTLSRPILVSLATIQFDSRAIEDMREVRINGSPTERFTRLLQERYGRELSAEHVQTTFSRLKALLAVKSKFTVCASIDAHGGLSVIDGSHRCAASFLNQVAEIYVVVGVRKRHNLARIMKRIGISYPQRSL